LLLDAKADPNCEDDLFSRTALHKAAMWGSASAARVLLEYGAKVDPVAHNLWTPLHEASTPHRDGESKRKIINLLLEHGASPTALTKRGKQPCELVHPEDQALRVALLSPRPQQPPQAGAWWKAASGARYWLEPGQRLAFAPMFNKCHKSTCLLEKQRFSRQPLLLDADSAKQASPLICAACGRFAEDTDCGLAPYPCCNVLFCDVVCSRRSPCPHIGDLLVPQEVAYVEAMESGCQCSCCQAFCRRCSRRPT